MNSKIVFIVSTFFALILFTSCSTDDEKDHAFNYINLEFYEHFSSENSFIHFNLSTLESFPCNNFTLEVQVETYTGHTEIQVIDIDVPDICITTIGPATQLLQIAPPNEINPNFTLWVNDKRHEFKINIADNLISIEQGKPFDNHLFFNFDTLMRIPENTVWGYVIFEQSKNEKNNIWTEIMKAFKDAGATELLLDNGFYYYFSVKNNEIQFDNIKQDIITFHFHFDEPLEVLTEIFYRVTEQFQDTDIQLRLFNTKGERFIM
ncbi:MAG: hypothetical protein EA361_06705 [Bacteroidetes bacterium]|nr:MAG: hypothetical protein EA361_06705 [Bacteroidota bacterium]